jgi:hypothetical protein
MGGQEGNRGYLIQTVIALLKSLDDATWTSVTIEPDSASDKVDILWEGTKGRKAVQVKSSINPISKPNGISWARALKSSISADHYELVLIGPTSKGLARLGTSTGVSIPSPKNLDFDGLLGEAAHLLDKFLQKEGLGRGTPTQRELIAKGLVTQLSLLASGGVALSRADFVKLLKEWLSSISGPENAAWTLVTFGAQRGIAAAVAGNRLGPADVDVCPAFSVRAEIIKELDRSHIYELVGVPGCGKSITAWQVAKHYHEIGFAVWRPQALAPPVEILSNIPTSNRRLLVLDDAQSLGGPVVARLAESASETLKVLIVSTVEEAQLATAICIHPAKCVDELSTALLNRRDELLPIVRSHDDRIGDRPFEIAIETRLHQSGRQKTPWAFFWFLRGGWNTAEREYSCLSQFPHAGDVLMIVAAGQIISCDAGVSKAWLVEHCLKLGLHVEDVDLALANLSSLSLIEGSDVLRTKHIQYAYRLIDRFFRDSNRKDWPKLVPRYLDILMDRQFSLRGVSWLLEGVQLCDAFRWLPKEQSAPLVGHLVTRCTADEPDAEWAAGCLSRVFSHFEVPPEEILQHRQLLLCWVTTGTGVIAYFCNGIINGLINASQREDPARKDLAREFNEAIDVSKLVALANGLQLDDFHSFGSLLNRLAFYGPSWSGEFMAALDWPRLKGIILAADVDRAYAVDKITCCISKLGETASPGSGIKYIEEISPYLVTAINSRPADALNEMHDVFWSCLGLAPSFLRGGDAPDDDQLQAAAKIVAGLSPQAFAEAMAAARPRDLEGLAQSFAVIHEVERSFVGKVGDLLKKEDFFKVTVDEWKLQTRELQQLLAFFCSRTTFEPARSWVDANSAVIDGPLNTRLALIAPEVAVAFQKSGRGVKLLDAYDTDWNHTGLAIARIMSVDKDVCLELVNQQLPEFEEALYKLNLDPPKWIAYFFRVLHELSPEALDKLLDRIDLDTPAAAKTIKQLVTNQRREHKAYVKLARAGRAFPGKLGSLAQGFLERVEQAEKAEAE